MTSVQLNNLLLLHVIQFDFFCIDIDKTPGGNNGMHIRGSECDQKILSKRESAGLVYSPNYPYPYLPKTVCRYVLSVHRFFLW